MKPVSTLSILLVTSTAFALPRPNSRVQSGANHHLGDTSYEKTHGGQRPASHEVEGERMTTHLQYVRDWLASRPATKPELAAKRAEILAHFDAYIAKRTTPKNAHVPWRTPVFIDDEGTICAVGYLIEQTKGRALPEKIAKAHRYDFIEAIAQDMPEVAAWVAESGFTLEEISRIQPAYSEPQTERWRTWDLVKHRPADGAYDHRNARGTFRKARMEGAWVAYARPDENDPAETIVGRGTLVAGAGAWTSFYEDGKTKLGEGPYVDNRAHGAWRLYHRSGNLAAEGNFAQGDRDGTWRFYHDTPARTPLAIGAFAGQGGQVSGTWRHFDATGARVATTWRETPDQWSDRSWSVDGGEGSVIDVAAQPGEVAHRSHQGTVWSNPMSFERYALGAEQLYLHSAYARETSYDARGWKLERSETGAWTTSNCHWSEKRKVYAARGDLAPLHGVLYNEAHRRVKPEDSEPGGGGGVDETGPKCDGTTAVPAARAAVLERLHAAKERVHGVTPEMVRDEVLEEEGEATTDRAAVPAELARVLQQTMVMYLEWPHIDGRFEQLFETLPGRVTWNWTDGDPDALVDGD